MATRMVMESREKLQAFVSDGNYVCLKQWQTEMGEAPCIIALLPEQVPVVIDWLRELMTEVNHEEA